MLPDKEKKPVRIWPVVRAYFAAAAQYPWLLVGALASTVIIEISGVTAPLFLSSFINTLSMSLRTPAAVHTLLLILVGFSAVALVGWLGRRLQTITVMKIESRAMSDLANNAFQYLIKHSYEFFSSNFAGTLTRRVTRYSRSFEQVLDTVVFNFFDTFIFAVGVIGVLFIKNWILGAALLVWTVVFITLQIILTRWKHPFRVARAEEDSKMTGVLSDAIGNHSAIMVFAARKHENSIFSQVVDAWQKATIRSWGADSWLMAIQGLFSLLVQVVLLVAAVYLWQRNLITIGDFVLIQLYVLGLIDRVWNVGNVMRRIYDAFADASEMVDIFETPLAISDVPGAKNLVVTDGAIECKSVSFNFNETRAVLENFNLSIRGGEKIALVGPSGAGKSTVIRLLLRFYNVTSGEIEIDGQNIAHVTQDSLRESIAFVPQEPVLFHRTLMENIRYGKLDATDEEVMEAAKKAHCHEFIAALPDQYATYVGERGIKLSGGERQRVAIARAILKNAPLLVLDEATSSLDSESEMLIQNALKVLMEGKTVVVIAHRLSTIMNMDRIIVLEDGKIAAEGTHAKLLEDPEGLYHKLWSIQAGGFMPD